MPRVTVNKESSAVTPLPSPTPVPAPELAQPEPLPEIPLTDHQSDAPPPVEPVPPAPPPVTKIVREIKTVLIEVPLCDNPPGLDGTPSFCKAHVNLQLIKSRSPTGRNLLHRLWWGLKETGAKLGTGRKVFNRNDAVVWLIEQLEERE
jgi:hypothetical protein